jgi:hypothetical protein
MTVAEARAFIRKVMGPARRLIEGQEREHLFLVFNLIEPTSESNNQHTWTSVYHHAGKEYHYTEGSGFDELAEILPDDIQQD